MDLFLYNSLTRRKEKFIPVEHLTNQTSYKLPYQVKMYVCGPTVYDFAHLGNARAMVVFDTLFRVLKHRYQDVHYVRNITDIDDKICAVSAQAQCSFLDIASKFEHEFRHDMEALNVLEPTHMPKATEFIEPMIQMISALIEKGFAYESNHHVLFDVEQYPDYGLLSKKDKKQLLAGARIEVASYKKNSADFVLWKPSDTDTPGWESPWGRGRPGWHIECSAMTSFYFNETFDIHGGGIDLIFPHHENERAQSCAALDTKETARFWLHNGHLLINGKKMSKSLSNFLTVRDLLQEFNAEAIRLALITTHYRQPFDWTQNSITQANQILNRWYQILDQYPSVLQQTDQEIENLIQLNIHQIEESTQVFFQALLDDLNTPLAIQILGQMLRHLEKTKQAEEAVTVCYCGRLLGLFYQPASQRLHSEQPLQLSGSEIEEKIQARTLARQNKDFATSDQIRDELAEYGIVLKDTKDGTTWHRS